MLVIRRKKYQIVFREAISCHPFVRVLFLRVTKMHRGVMRFFVTLCACTVFFGPVMIYKWGHTRVPIALFEKPFPCEKQGTFENKLPQ